MTLSALLAKRADAIRRVYVEGLASVVESPLEATAERDLTVYTFSNEPHVPEQVASLRSLIRHLGIPRRIVVVSDGTHTPESARLIGRVHPRVSVVHYRDVVRSDLPKAIERFVEANRVGAKLAMEYSIEIDGPTMYSDADILFYPGIAEVVSDTFRDGGRPRFLVDFDTRFLNERIVGDDERQPPTNSGFTVLFERLSWDAALERFEAVDPSDLVPERYRNHEQSVVHVALRESGGEPLPRDRFVLEVDDELDWRDRYSGPHIAMRHYCYSDEVQRKLWLNVWDDLAAVARSSPRSGIAALFAATRRWREDRR